MISSIESGQNIDQRVHTSVLDTPYTIRLNDRLRQAFPNKQRLIVTIGSLALIGGSLFIGVRNVDAIDAAVSLRNNPVIEELLYKPRAIYPGQIERTHSLYAGQDIFK